MKHGTIKVEPLRDDTLRIALEKPVIRKKFAPAVRVHGNKGYERNKDWMDFKKE